MPLLKLCINKKLELFERRTTAPAAGKNRKKTSTKKWCEKNSYKMAVSERNSHKFNRNYTRFEWKIICISNHPIQRKYFSKRLALISANNFFGYAAKIGKKGVKFACKRQTNWNQKLPKHLIFLLLDFFHHQQNTSLTTPSWLFWWSCETEMATTTKLLMIISSLGGATRFASHSPKAHKRKTLKAV